MKILQFVACGFFLVANSAVADITSQLGKFVGYTIVAGKTIAGYQDSDGKKGNSFEGCNYGRVIIFDDNTILTCAGYGYQYAYRPTAIILSRGGQFKMIVENEIYDMNR